MRYKSSTDLVDAEWYGIMIGIAIKNNVTAPISEHMVLFKIIKGNTISKSEHDTYDKNWHERAAKIAKGV